MEWVSVDERQPPVLGDWPEHSVTVLITDGREIWTGYRVTWEDNEFPPQWHLAGRDAYGFDGVTHWMPLPELP